jgi:hypothetical protein
MTWCCNKRLHTQVQIIHFLRFSPLYGAGHYDFGGSYGLEDELCLGNAMKVRVVTNESLGRRERPFDLGTKDFSLSTGTSILYAALTSTHPDNRPRDPHFRLLHWSI